MDETKDKGKFVSITLINIFVLPHIDLILDHSGSWPALLRKAMRLPSP